MHKKQQSQCTNSFYTVKIYFIYIYNLFIQICTQWLNKQKDCDTQPAFGGMVQRNYLGEKLPGGILRGINVWGYLGGVHFMS